MSFVRLTAQDDSNMEKPSLTLRAQYIKIAGAVGLYWFVSISLVFLNKYLLSSPDLKLDAPLFVTWFQCVISVLLCAIFGKLAASFPNYISFPEFAIDKKISREVLPLSCVFVLMMAFNNLCLKYVGVSFYYLGRSLTIVFNVICSYLILGQKTSIKAMLCCGIVISGYFVGVDQESLSATYSFKGVLFGVAASLCVALFAIFTKRVLPMVSDNIWRLTLYNNLNACVIFIPLILFNGEISSIIGFANFAAPNFWIAMVTSGVFGFGMGYVTGLQIQVTSPLTHNISGTAKAAAQTVLAVVWYMEIKAVLWWASNAVVLFGSTAYTMVKRNEMKAADTAAKAAAQPKSLEEGEEGKGLLAEEPDIAIEHGQEMKK